MERMEKTTVYVGHAQLDERRIEVGVVPGYEELFDILIMALNEAQHGKGKERHATDKDFLDQPIMQIQSLVGRGYALGQAIKKTQESQRLEPEAAKRELLGAINYLAAAVLSYGD